MRTSSFCRRFTVAETEGPQPCKEKKLKPINKYRRRRTQKTHRHRACSAITPVVEYETDTRLCVADFFVDETSFSSSSEEEEEGEEENALCRWLNGGSSEGVTACATNPGPREIPSFSIQNTNDFPSLILGADKKNDGRDANRNDTSWVELPDHGDGAFDVLSLSSSSTGDQPPSFKEALTHNISGIPEEMAMAPDIVMRRTYLLPKRKAKPKPNSQQDTDGVSTDDTYVESFADAESLRRAAKDARGGRASLRFRGNPHVPHKDRPCSCPRSVSRKKKNCWLSVRKHYTAPWYAQYVC